MISPYLLILLLWFWMGLGAADPVPRPVSAALSSVTQPLTEGLDAYRMGQFRRAYSLLEPLAKGGNAQAQCTLAMMYSSGNGVDLEERQAVYWFELAAAQGYRDAEYFLAKIHEQGWGTDRSLDQAIHWYQRCVEHGDPRCTARLMQLQPLGSKGSTAESLSSRPVVSVAPSVPPITTPPTVPPTAPPSTPSPSVTVSPPLATATSPSVSGTTPSTLVPAPLLSVTTPPTAPPPSPAPSVAAPPTASPEAQAPAPFLGEDWVRSQPLTHYTIQVFTAPHEQEARAFALQHGLTGDLALIAEVRKGKVWYNLLAGAYKTASTANQALAALPSEATKGGAWVRRFRDVHLASTESAPVQ